jgi:hypothetical protein
MINFLKDQPEAARVEILAALSAEVVELSILLKLDFADEPLYLSNRNLPFVDQKWGHTWGAGAGLLVRIPEIGTGEGELAPFREYALGLPVEAVEGESWAKTLNSMCGDVANYRGREIGLYAQIFNPETRQPIGLPMALDVGLMDRMGLSIQRAGAVVTLTSESFMARKGVPVYGMQTYQDQKRRFPTDEGLQFVTEYGKSVDWTNF